MWHLRRPSESQLVRFHDEQSGLSFSYEPVGSMGFQAVQPHATTPPAGYDFDRNRIQLGRGERVFTAACETVRRWQQYPPSWTEIWPHNAPHQVGQTVVMVARVYGLWWLNACRIVQTFADERRFGFVYGTLPGHVEQGEERFLVERDDADVVWYEIQAFSRPRYWATRLAYPLARRQQRRFVRESQAILKRVAETAAIP